MNQQNKQKQTHRYRQQNGGYQRGSGSVEGALGKGGQIYGNGKKVKFGCGTHNRVHRSPIIMYTGNLCNVINNCYCNKYNFKMQIFLDKQKFISPS